MSIIRNLTLFFTVFRVFITILLRMSVDRHGNAVINMVKPQSVMSGGYAGVV